MFVRKLHTATSYKNLIPWTLKNSKRSKFLLAQNELKLRGKVGSDIPLWGLQWGFDQWTVLVIVGGEIPKKGSKYSTFFLKTHL